MRIGILADTHDEFDRTTRAIEILRAAGAEALIHCGDLASPPIVSLLSALPAWFVFGNHDADAVPHLTRASSDAGVVCLGWGGVVDLGGKAIGVVHGHLGSDLRDVLANKPNFLLSGHSHASLVWQDGLVCRINPGALHRADEFTVATLDTELDAVRFLAVT